MKNWQKCWTSEIENYLSADTRQIKSKRISVQKGMETEFFKNFYRKSRWHGQFVKVSQVQKKQNLSVVFNPVFLIKE